MTARAACSNRPVLASLLESRTMCACIAGAAVAHLGLVAAGLDGWPCPVRHSLGIPCPGCGLGRAGALLLRGQFEQSLHVHAFAGVVLGGLALFGLCAVLPNNVRGRLAQAVGALENRVPLVPPILGALLIYWLLRFVLDAPGFVRLVT